MVTYPPFAFLEAVYLSFDVGNGKPSDLSDIVYNEN